MEDTNEATGPRPAGDLDWEWRVIVSATGRCIGCGRKKEELDDFLRMACRSCGWIDWPNAVGAGIFALVLGGLGLAAFVLLDGTCVRWLGGAAAISSGVGLAFMLVVAIPLTLRTSKIASAGYASRGRMEGTALWLDVVKENSAEERQKAACKLERRVGSLTRPVSLALVAAFGSDVQAAIAVVARLEDQDLLKAVAECREDRDVVLAVVARLEDQDSLLAVAERRRDREIVLSVVRRLTDERALSKVASSEMDVEACREALSRIRDETAIYAVADRSQRDEIQRCALAKLRDEKAILSLALRHPALGLLAVGKLTDQTALVRMAREHPYIGVQEAAVERITDQGRLLRLAKSHNNPDVRAGAFRRITDPTLAERARPAKEARDQADKRARRDRETEERRGHEEARGIQRQLRVGMSMAEVIELLGQPNSGRSGAELLGAFGDTSIVSADPSRLLSRLGGRRYCVWERPEGRYQLIVEGDRLVQIYSCPDLF